MKKYLRLQCTTCRRTVDKLVDNTRFEPDRCTITLKCQGRLVPVEYRSDRQIAATPAAGVLDWVPRGTTFTTTTETSQSFIETSTGSLDQLVIGLKLLTEPAAGATASLTLALKPETPKVFKSFIFQRSSEFDSISGVEDGISRKTLRFQAWGPDPDVVEVFIDGVKQTQGVGPTEFQVDDGTALPPAPSNTIKFNTPVTPEKPVQVEVVVSKAVPLETFTLVFNRNQDNEARLGLGAWENVSKIERTDGVSTSSFYLFTYDVLGTTTIPVNAVMFPTGTVTVTDGAVVELVALADAFVALSRKPHTKVDRYPDTSSRLSDITADAPFRFIQEGTTRTLSVDASTLRSTFPPSTVVKFNPEPTIKTPVAGETEQLVVDGKVIVGPDT